MKTAAIAINSALAGLALGLAVLVRWDTRERPWLVDAIWEYQTCGIHGRDCGFDERGSVLHGEGLPPIEVRQKCVEAPPTITSTENGEFRELTITCKVGAYTGVYTVVANRNREWGTVATYRYFKEPARPPEG